MIIENPYLTTFRSFIAQSDEFLKRRLPADHGTIVVHFESFVRRSRSLVLSDIRSRTIAVAPSIKQLGSWLARKNVLGAGGCGGRENSCTDLVAWVLNGFDDPDLAVKFQAAWLGHILRGRVPIHAGRIYSQLAIPGGGIPDLVLHFDRPEDRFVVIIETKLGTEEHLTPAGSYQTESYPEHVKRYLGLPADYPHEMLLLTPDRRDPISEEARATTFLDFAVAIALAISPEVLDDETRWACSFALSFFFIDTAPENTNMANIVRQLCNDPNTEASTGFILGNLDAIVELLDVIGDARL